MPETNHIDSTIVMIDAVNDTIESANNNLANGWISKLRRDTSHFRKIRQTLCAVD